MLDFTNYPFANHLLAVVPEPEMALMAPHLKLQRLHAGELLSDSGETVKHVYFPTTAIVSMLFLMADGATAEVAAVGNEGVIGVPVLMGGATMPNRIEVRSGGYAYSMSAQIFKREFEQHGPVHKLMLLYIQALLTQIAQNALCNRHHHIVKQVSSWLLLTHDRLKSDELVVTQQLIATMLGVRREGVTEAAGKLQDAGLISMRRGHITVLDREGLEEHACECYGIVKREFRRLLLASAAEKEGATPIAPPPPVYRRDRERERQVVCSGR
ncbi:MULTISPECIES: Crp/Fnr family transcriptional regulator [Paraburkholderia]|uniref:Crp/Fnr family transcriptional regulator n=1 Tax=Paraburkholderia madseniana TaxID=2599607 RepID=A0AAP5EZR4_9BURK|nr:MULTISPECIES: Crp/Fnr family transcriptional regulator [Paraburkholderia]MCX4149879.1 Crp/Fnr family transcriptional regulator [Paraburkholderia madseniana]MDN7152815.1 Crp/Fnr family transcriptional regulator [Paraburkholderia sp. WS6]MDQ6411697.1 Crp/Fnr family transcriptional regulator [Paraburkholderia madseniana]